MSPLTYSPHVTNYILSPCFITSVSAPCFIDFNISTNWHPVIYGFLLKMSKSILICPAPPHRSHIQCLVSNLALCLIFHILYTTHPSNHHPFCPLQFLHILYLCCPLCWELNPDALLPLQGKLCFFLFTLTTCCIFIHGSNQRYYPFIDS